MYASESPVIQELLLHARPLAGRTWNAYIAAITTDPRREDLYVKNLLSLAEEIIDAINPEKCSPETLVELKKSARERDSWPGFISSHESLEINAYDGRKRKRSDPGAAAEVAAILLAQLREEAARFSVSRVTKRPHWDFFYIIPEPPEYHAGNKEIWSRLVGTLLDLNHGTKAIRTAARKHHIEEQRANLFSLPNDQEWSMTDILHELDNKKTQAPEFIETELRLWENRDMLSVTPPTKITPKNQNPNRWDTEELPCILAFPNIHRHCSALIKRAKGKNEVQSANAVYNQFRKDVLRAAEVRLPRPPETAP